MKIDSKTHKFRHKNDSFSILFFAQKLTLFLTMEIKWILIYIYIYIYIYSILGPVKPELGVIPPGQEIIHEWIFKKFPGKEYQ